MPLIFGKCVHPTEVSESGEIVKRCNERFFITDRSQQFYKDMDYPLPKRCMKHRKKTILENQNNNNGK